MEDDAWITSVADMTHVAEVVVYDTKVHPLSDAVHSHSKVCIRDKSGFALKGFPATVFHYCLTSDPPSEYVLFLHGHDTAWHQKMTIRDIVQHCGDILSRNRYESEPIHFMKLSDCVYDDWMEFKDGYGMLDFVHRYWPQVQKFFPDEDSPPLRMLDINTEQCMVHHSRLKLHTRDKWGDLFELACECAYRSWEEHALEGVFHHLLGEPWEREFISRHLDHINNGHNELETRLL